MLDLSVANHSIYLTHCHAFYKQSRSRQRSRSSNVTGPGKISPTIPTETTDKESGSIKSKYTFFFKPNKKHKTTNLSKNVFQPLSKTRLCVFQETTVLTRNSYRFAVILPGWSGHKLPSESTVPRKHTTEHETAQTSNTRGSITVMSHLPPATYALSVHSFCELRSQRKTTTLSSSSAAGLCWLHRLLITIKTTTLSSSLAAARLSFTVYLSPSVRKAHVLGSTSLLLSSLCIHFLVGVLFFELLSHSPTRLSSF